MPTPLFGLPLYGDDDTAELDALLNGQSTSVEAALGANIWHFQGTTAQRDAMSAPLLRDGVTFRDTSTGILWMRSGGAWKAVGDTLSASPAKVLVGPIPPAGTLLIRQSGILQTASPTNSNGDGSIDYPVPFPNGVISAHMDRYDLSTVGPSLQTIHTVQTLTTLNYRIYGPSGAVAPGIRPWFSIDVVGW